MDDVCDLVLCCGESSYLQHMDYLELRDHPIFDNTNVHILLLFLCVIWNSEVAEKAYISLS